MNDTLNGGDLEPVVDEQTEADGIEDQDLAGFDNLDDAVDALEDDMPENEEPETEDEAPEDDPEEASEAEESDAGDAIVELPDGNTLSLSEIADLQANGLRSADYTQKTTELAREREAVDTAKSTYSERLQFAETALQNVYGFVERLIPPEPSIDLARTDPGQYTQQQALRSTAINEIRGLMAMKDDLQGHKTAVSDQDQTAYRNTETEALVKAMPHLRDPVKKAAFDDAVSKTAQEFGFTADEVAQTADSRILQLVHYARIGKRSEQNRNNAKRRVQTPAKGKARPAQIPAKERSNRNAMQRLSKSGSIADAMEIDFD